MKFLVHIGHHKTASSFLQREVFPNHPQIHFVPPATTKDLFLRVGAFHFDADAARRWLRETADAAPADRPWTVLSDEELSGNIHTGGNGGYLAKVVADRLHAVFPDAHIALFIRNQPDMIESVYRQYVKRGGTYRIRRYLFNNNGQPHRFPQFRFEHFEYDRIVGYYQSLFGAARVHVVLYEKFRRDAQTSINALFETIGIPPMTSSGARFRRSVNARYSVPSMFLARLTNRFHDTDPISRTTLFHIPYSYHLFRTLYERLDRLPFISRIGGRRAYVTGAVGSEVGRRYGESNRKLADLLNVDLEAWGYPMGSATP